MYSCTGVSNHFSGYSQVQIRPNRNDQPTKINRDKTKRVQQQQQQQLYLVVLIVNNFFSKAAFRKNRGLDSNNFRKSKPKEKGNTANVSDQGC